MTSRRNNSPCGGATRDSFIDQRRERDYITRLVRSAKCTCAAYERYATSGALPRRFSYQMSLRSDMARSTDFDRAIKL